MSVIINNIQNDVLEKGVYYLTSDYKTRNDSRTHNGIDLIGKNKSIDKVVAIADGVVITSKKSKSAGNYVEIKHANNFVSRYLHMKDKSVLVKKGDIVRKGDIIGTMGNTGNSSGAHLHLGILDKNGKVIDPLPYLLGEKNFNIVIDNDYYKNFVLNVQRVLNVKQDGIAGPNTLKNTITVSSKTNRKQPIVKVIQEYLYNIGYTEVGKIDGIAGSNFTKAVKHFQKDNDCVTDGIITKRAKTWQKLLKLK